MTNYRVFRISKRCHTLHDFLEVPHSVIPNLFRDLCFFFAEGGGPLTENVVFTAFSGFLFLSVQRFLERDAETSSDDAKGRVSNTGYGVS